MTSQEPAHTQQPIYRRSPWLPRGKVRKCILLLLILLGAYGCTQHRYYLTLIGISVLILSPKVLLATAHYYGKSTLFLGQLFSK